MIKKISRLKIEKYRTLLGYFFICIFFSSWILKITLTFQIVSWIWFNAPVSCQHKCFVFALYIILPRTWQSRSCLYNFFNRIITRKGRPVVFNFCSRVRFPLSRKLAAEHALPFCCKMRHRWKLAAYSWRFYPENQNQYKSWDVEV